MTIQAKFYVREKAEVLGYNCTPIRVLMNAVMAQEGEDSIFGQSTPSGNIEMTIMNPVASNQFKVGEKYYVNFLSEKEHEELGDVSVDYLADTGATFDFVLAFSLLKEGEIVKRKSEKYGFKLAEYSDGENSHPDIAMVNEEGKVMAFYALTSEQMLAKDWQVMKLEHV